MSADSIIGLADAVTAVINAAVTAETLTTVGFTARRSYPDWDDDFKDLKNLAVDVVFVSSNGTNGDLFELDSAGTVDTEPAIDIAIRKRFEPADQEQDGRLKNSSVDPLVNLVSEINDLFSANRMTAIDCGNSVHANWVDNSIRTRCDYKRLREGCFLGVVRIRYDVSKAG